MRSLVTTLRKDWITTVLNFRIDCGPSCRCERAQRVSHANGASRGEAASERACGESEGRSPSD